MLERIDTKTLLASSLLQLSKKRSLPKITVVEIAYHCSMSRETFYYHFADKYELMLWIYKKQIDDIVKKGILQDPIINVWKKALKTIQDYTYFYKYAFEDTVFLNDLLKLFIEDITYCITSHTGLEEPLNSDMEFTIRFYANGLLNMTIEWLKKGKKEEVDTISRRMCEIMPHVLMKYYIFK